MKQNFVTFLYPGTFLSEEASRTIETWEPAVAAAMTLGMKYSPFAFYFTTRERTDTDLDSKETKRSGRYYLGGRVLTLEQVEKEMPDKDVLISNMRGNRWDRIIITKCGNAQPLLEKDNVLQT